LYRDFKYALQPYTLPRHQLAKCFAFHKLCRNEMRAACLSNFVDRDDIWMIECGGCYGFLLESPHTFQVLRICIG
jgi:hypothetical protein